MKLKTQGIGLSAFCCLVSASWADDDSHLLPEDSIYSEFSLQFKRDGLVERYDENVLRVLSEVFSKEVFGRVIVQPSFQNEYAIALKRNDDKFSVLFLEPSIHIWKYSILEMYESGEIKYLDDEDDSKFQNDLEELKAGLPVSLEDVPLEKCEYELPVDVGESLFTLWAEMLYRTRYSDKRPVSLVGEDTQTIRLDGTTYHFSFEYGADRLAGKIWSPASKSETGKFVQITDMLSGACRKRDNTLVERARKETENLLERLSQFDY